MDILKVGKLYTVECGNHKWGCEKKSFIGISGKQRFHADRFKFPFVHKAINAKSELDTWRAEFPHLRSYIKEVMK